MFYEDITSQLQLMALLIILALLILSLSNRRITKKTSRHKRNIKTADYVLDKLALIHNPAKQFAYLRKVDPFVYEEMIMTAIKRYDHKIIRNKKYTGDGGIDGKAVINGVKTIIQAKRYSSYIANKDVEEFSSLCRKLKSKGIFVHTGKTGRKPRESTNPNVDILSGRRMLDLLTGNKFQPKWSKMNICPPTIPDKFSTSFTETISTHSQEQHVKTN